MVGDKINGQKGDYHIANMGTLGPVTAIVSLTKNTGNMQRALDFLSALPTLLHSKKYNA